MGAAAAVRVADGVADGDAAAEVLGGGGLLACGF